MPHFSEISYAQFAEWVEDALLHLYDSAHLQKHPLLMLVAHESQPALRSCQRLRRYLLETLQELRPEPGTPAQSPDWRRFRILEVRYIEGLSVAECLEELALGRSQFYRDHASALERIVEILWQDAQKRRAQDDASATAPYPHNGEISRFAATVEWRTIALAVLVEELTPAIGSLAALRKQAIEIDIAPTLTIQGDPVLVRQSLLNLTSLALEIAGGPQIRLRGFSAGTEVGVVYECAPGRIVENLDEHPHFSNCQRLIQHQHGTIAFSQQGDAFEIRLLWPASRPSILLIVDDNIEYVNLLRRHLMNSPCRVLTAQNGVQAREVVESTTPDAIILDIMLPAEDGWSLLAWFRACPATARTPILISSVITDQEMAVALGADGFLPKQMDAEYLLETLARWQIHCEPYPD